MINNNIKLKHTPNLQGSIGPENGSNWPYFRSQKDLYKLIKEKKCHLMLYVYIDFVYKFGKINDLIAAEDLDTIIITTTNDNIIRL